MSCLERQNKYFPPAASAGLTFSHVVTIDGYKAPEWSLSVLVRGPKGFDLEGAADGESFAFSATAEETALWVAGQYQYSMRATDGVQVVQIDSGALEISGDFAALADGFDGRSPAQIGLEAIDAVLARRATIDQERYTINNRELWRTPIADLLKLRAYYATKVRRENARRTENPGFGRIIQVRFDR